MILMYTTHCPKCKVLAEKLNKVGIKFEECEDMNILVSKGFKQVPMLEVEGKMLTFMEAIKWASEVL